MALLEPPPWAAWRHHPGRQGFEVVFAHRDGDCRRFHGTTTAVEDGVPMVVDFHIDVDESWHSRRAEVHSISRAGRRRVVLESDGKGHWTVNGIPSPGLDGCPDVDVETSCFTNTFPVHRLALAVGAAAAAPAAYVRGEDLNVQRLEQEYARLEDDGGRQRYHYDCPTLDFACRLTYDEHGLVLDYPRVGTRAG
jgi:hypothetical protein